MLFLNTVRLLGVCAQYIGRHQAMQLLINLDRETHPNKPFIKSFAFFLGDTSAAARKAL